MKKNDIRKFLGLTVREFANFETSVGGISGRYCSFYRGTVYPSTTVEKVVAIQNSYNFRKVRYFIQDGTEVFKDYFSTAYNTKFLRRDNCIVLNNLDDAYSTSYDFQKFYMTENEYREKVAIDALTHRHCLKENLIEVDGEMINKLHVYDLTVRRNPFNRYVFKTPEGFHLIKNYVRVDSDYDTVSERPSKTEFLTQAQLDELVASGEIILCEDEAYERKEYVQTFEDKKYSSTYFNQHFKKCEHCNKPHRIEDLKTVYSSSGRTMLWCSDCVAQYAISYNGKLYEKSALVEIDGTVYTNAILATEIYSYHNYTRSGHRYTPLSLEGENTEMYFGTELETQSENDANYAYVLHGKCADIFHCERDSSIGRGAESISAPMSLAYVKSRAEDIREMFANLYSHGVKGHNADNACCGFHIHVSRKAFKDEDAIMRANVIINNFQSECEKLARRTSSRYYAYNPITGVITKEKVYLPSGHSYAVNNQNSKTIEFRIFRSTLNLETYIGTIEFVKNVVDAANNKQTRIYFSDLLKGEYLPLYIEDLNTRRINQHLEPIDGTKVIDFTGFYQNDLKKILLDKKDIKESLARLRKRAEEFKAKYPEYSLGGVE